MQSLHANQLRGALAPFLERSPLLAWSLFLGNLTVYAAAVAGAVALTPTPFRLGCAILAGSAISALFVIGHDAAHGAYTDDRRLNAFIGRIAFLPALHNYSLWRVQHNRLHHRLTNLKGFNSWSPLAKAEYDALPSWRRAVERLYRSPLGFAPYYLIERWWRDKFFPRSRVNAGQPFIFWLDFALLLTYLAAFLTILASAGQSGAASAILWGFVVPFLTWNALMGATTYMQHTHQHVPWFESMAEWRALDGQEEVSVHVQMPRWYGLISHHVMDHPAHHVHPKIPLYHLASAQRRLNELLGNQAITQRFSPAYLLSTLTRCKLYDYRDHRWLDFAGRPTSNCTLPVHLHTSSALKPAVTTVA
jgi:acyl-lipid omega-6 desaturase (Delta-12 desaturase)